MAKKTYFFEQHEDERVVLLLHRHWSALIGKINKFFVFLFILIALYVVILIFLPFLTEQPYIGLILFASSLYLLFLWAWLSLKIVDYYLDVWIITNERIVNIEQTGLLKRTSSTLNLSNILDVTTNVSGLSATLFHYGNLYVQTAAEKDRFSIERIGHPEKVKAIIMDLYHNALTQERSEMFQKQPVAEDAGKNEAPVSLPEKESSRKAEEENV